MRIKINKELTELSKLFKKNKKQLYIVGGYVRDNLLGLIPTDIDICSTVINEELFVMLKNSSFNISLASKKLGTTIISKNNIRFEHTTFRKESYKKGGFHTPEKVEFIKDLIIDAKRRDFTVNSFYYDIEKLELIDPFNAIKDLNKKTIKAIINPEYVFKSDGLRILRLVRIASELNFSIEAKTFSVAKKLKEQLKDVSKDRRFKEFKLILNSSEKYGNKQQGIKLLLKLDVLDYIFPNIRVLSPEFSYKTLVKGLSKQLYYCNAVKEELKFSAFIIDMCLHLNKKLKLKLSDLSEKILNSKVCGIPGKERMFVICLVKAYQASLGLETDYQVKNFIQDYYKVITELLVLLNNEKDNILYNKINRNYNYMIKNKIPITLKDLALNGKVIKAEFKTLKEKQIGEELNKALKFCLLAPKNNTSQKLIAYLKKEKL